jgi:sialate O-acetylesterase
MHTTQGLFDHMVLQRNARGVSEAAFEGQCAAAGVLTARVTKGRRALKAFDGVAIGRARRGTFRGELRGLPVGGPYRIELRIAGKDGKTRERLAVTDVLVGDVWILGGQSNMEGCGRLSEAEKPAPFVRAFFMNDRWIVAREPLHDLSLAVDPVHTDLNGGVRPAPKTFTGTGPGLAFGKEMLRRTGVPQGLLACAHGGTSMSQWDPALKSQGGKSLYGATVRRMKKNGGRVAGVAWYQGCSDAGPDTAPLYTKRMKKLISAFRRDTGNPRLPVVIVQIARFYGQTDGSAHWNSVQEQQRKLPRVISHLATVPAIDLDLDDGIHVGGKGQGVLGRRLAQAMLVLRDGRKAGLPPVDVKKVTVERNEQNGAGEVVVELAGVVGKLKSQGRPEGFEILNPRPTRGVFQITLEGKRARLRTCFAPHDLSKCLLSYGHGFSPYCNVTDAAGRPLPVFGPLPLGRPRALTPHVNKLRVSKLLPSAGKLHGLAYPADLGALGLEPRTFDGEFCNRHPELAARAPEDVLVYFACRVKCAEAMRLSVSLGYDGPVKVWLDGREVFHDPDGINPALPGDEMIRWAVEAGEHEVLVALGSNGGLAWGIFLRFERQDVALRLLKQGPGHYALPEALG